MPKQPLIVGSPVFVVVDMQESGDMPAEFRDGLMKGIVGVEILLAREVEHRSAS